jgi:uridine kinase
MRRQDIGWVGTGEVHLDLMDQNLADIIAGENTIDKPLVAFDEDRIDSERLSLEGVRVAIVEGTYTTCLENVHQRVFNARNYMDTKQARQKRAREKQDESLEKILRIEHEIISAQRSRADIIVNADYEVMKNDISR